VVEIGVKYRVGGRPWGRCRCRGRCRDGARGRDRGDGDVAGGWRRRLSPV
jgi:hypothetical protein